jgi:hypothetical protein
MGLFSAVVAVMLSVTLQDLRQNPQDTSVFYLENLYKLQILADSNASLPSTPAEPPLFSSPKYAIWVNALFFMTLCLNLFTATLALSMQGRLPRHLLKIESPHLNPQHRARMQEIIASELKHLRVRWLLGIMIQVSAWFFFCRSCQISLQCQPSCLHARPLLRSAGLHLIFLRQLLAEWCKCIP